MADPTPRECLQKIRDICDEWGDAGPNRKSMRRADDVIQDIWTVVEHLGSGPGCRTSPGERRETSYLRMLIAPKVGSLWEWQPLKSYARCLLRVTDVKWDGDECWVESEPMVRNVYFNPAPNQGRIWNELAHWVASAVLVDLEIDEKPCVNCDPGW